MLCKTTLSVVLTVLFYHMEETIFSKIISRSIPADIVYETDDVIAFLDITPVNPGATLVVPKVWSRNVLTIDSDSWSKVMEVVRILAPIVKEAVSADGVNIIMNNEPAGNQMIFHSHVHIVPRFAGDTVPDWHGKPYPEGEQARTAEKIRGVLKERLGE